MIYFLYGADSYRSREKLREIIKGYREKHGNFLNFSRFDAEERQPADFRIAGKNQSLFSPKQMVVIENIFSPADKDFGNILKIAEFFRSKDDILVFWDGLESPSEKSVKEVLKISDKSQEFKKLDRAGLNLWLMREFKKRNLKLDYKESVSALCGSDLWCVKNELDKIEVGGFTTTNPNREERIFNLSDNFLKNKKEALSSLINLLKSGEDEFGLFAFIAGHFRNLLKVRSAMQSNKSLDVVTADLKLHPYVVKKAAVETMKRDEKFFRRIFYRIFREDVAIKTGVSTPAISLVKLLFFK